jgi:hypothetical protein
VRLISKRKYGLGPIKLQIGEQDVPDSAVHMVRAVDVLAQIFAAFVADGTVEVLQDCGPIVDVAALERLAIAPVVAPIEPVVAPIEPIEPVVAPTEPEPAPEPELVREHVPASDQPRPLTEPEIAALALAPRRGRPRRVV